MGIIRTRACTAAPNRSEVTVDFKRRNARCRRLRSFFTISRREIVACDVRGGADMTRLWLTANRGRTLKPPTRKGHPAVRKSDLCAEKKICTHACVLQIFEEPE
jgi:hypothetical protein